MAIENLPPAPQSQPGEKIKKPSWKEQRTQLRLFQQALKNTKEALNHNNLDLKPAIARLLDATTHPIKGNRWATPEDNKKLKYLRDRSDALALQVVLKSLAQKHHLPKLDPQKLDGLVGHRTISALKHFQIAYNKKVKAPDQIPEDGLFGPVTIQALQQVFNNEVLLSNHTKLEAQPQNPKSPSELTTDDILVDGVLEQFPTSVKELKSSNNNKIFEVTIESPAGLIKGQIEIAPQGHINEKKYSDQLSPWGLYKAQKHQTAK